MAIEAWLGEGPGSRRDGDLPARRPAAPDGPEVLFFVHIPKCAGSSFRQVLKRWFGERALFLDTHDHAALAEGVDRLAVPPRAIAGHLPFGLHQGLPLRPCCVSLVRHPLDRFVSFYGHARRTSDHPLHAAAARLDLEGFYDFSLQDERARGSTVAVQCFFLSRSRSFEAARAVIDRRYALLAPTERYGEFVAALAERFGRQPPELEPRNVGERQEGLEAARAILSDRIRADHAEDLKLFTYVCETFEARRGSLSFALHA